MQSSEFSSWPLFYFILVLLLKIAENLLKLEWFCYRCSGVIFRKWDVEKEKKKKIIKRLFQPIII